jgi:hypothetical protein
MKHAKAIGGLLLAGAIVLYKFQLVLTKLGSLLKFGAVVLVLLHLASPKDSTALAARPAHGPKAAHQVAQSATNNRADKFAGPSAAPPAGAPALMPAAPLGAGPINAARAAAAAQNAHLANETGQAVPTPGAARPGAPAPQNPTVASAPAMQQGAPTSLAAPNAAKARPAADSSPEVMRETFDYSRDTRRDPFVSLMTTSDLRPTLSDLRLTGILYDLSGRRPVAILRDVAGGQWRVTTGMTLGRMRVAQIRPKTIIFTIEEFGFNRQDSLVLGDTMRVRRR